MSVSELKPGDKVIWEHLSRYKGECKIVCGPDEHGNYVVLREPDGYEYYLIVDGKELHPTPPAHDDHIVDAEKIQDFSQMPQYMIEAINRGESWPNDPDLRDITLPSDEQLKEWGVKVVGFDTIKAGVPCVHPNGIDLYEGGYRHDDEASKRLIVAVADLHPNAERDDEPERTVKLERYVVTVRDGVPVWEKCTSVKHVQYNDIIDAITTQPVVQRDDDMAARVERARAQCRAIIRNPAVSNGSPLVRFADKIHGILRAEQKGGER